MIILLSYIIITEISKDKEGRQVLNNKLKNQELKDKELRSISGGVTENDAPATAVSIATGSSFIKTNPGDNGDEPGAVVNHSFRP